MKCPYCRSTKTDVYNTRRTKFGNQTWRRRRCLECRKTFTTYEAPDLRFLTVTGEQQNQSFNRAKLYSSVYQAFLEVPDKDDVIDAVTDTIESKLLDLKRETITLTEIRSNVLSTLKHFNSVAFVRYLTSQSPTASPAELARLMKKY
jgi:transcriptional repressor NrdR